MGQPAARLTDLHVCPMSDGPKPHVGGPITGPGVPTVLVGNMPQSVIGNMATCIGPPDILVMGSTTVLIGGRFSCRQLDSTAHGGTITVGFPTVLIGGPACVLSFPISTGSWFKGWARYLLGLVGIDVFANQPIKYGNIVIESNPADVNYQGKVLADLIMINNTPTGSALLKSLNDNGGAKISVGQSYTILGNRCWTNRTPPEVEYNPDRERLGSQPWQTRPPAIGLAHELGHANHAATDTLATGKSPNDAKPNPAPGGTPPQMDNEELNTAGIPPHDTDPYNENKIRSEWPVPQPQRQWY